MLKQTCMPTLRLELSLDTHVQNEHSMPTFWRELSLDTHVSQNDYTIYTVVDAEYTETFKENP